MCKSVKAKADARDMEIFYYGSTSQVHAVFFMDIIMRFQNQYEYEYRKALQRIIEQGG